LFDDQVLKRGRRRNMFFENVFGIGVDVIADVMDDLGELGFLERADSVSKRSTLLRSH